VIVLGIPVFLYWLTVADVKPPKGKFIMVTESRSMFKHLKVKLQTYSVWTPVRKPLMSLILVFLQSFPRLQILGLMMLSGVQLVLILHFQPFKTRKQNIAKIIAEILFLLSLFLLLCFPVFERRISVFQVKVLSWSVIGLFLTSFIVELVS
jgi:uncharacterized membrane protein SirB2